MHASHEQVAPPPDSPLSVRRSRRRKIAAMTLALSMMVLATLAIVTARPPRAEAQEELPIIAELTGECVAEQSVFHVSMTNDRATTFNFEAGLSSGGATGSNQVTEASVAAGGVFTFDWAPEAPQTAKWGVYFFDADQFYAPVGQTNLLDDPCSTTSTTDESTTDESTTDESTTDESTSESSSTDESTSEESTSESTSTDDLGFPTVTTTTDIDPVASTGGSGGGLAQTGVAVVVLIGGAAVLLFNGIGLTRITRRGWGLEDDEN